MVSDFTGYYSDRVDQASARFSLTAQAAGALLHVFVYPDPVGSSRAPQVKDLPSVNQCHKKRGSSVAGF